MSNYIQGMLRDPPPSMVLDMGLGSREQSMPVHDSKPVQAIAAVPSEAPSFVAPPAI